jgi:hypothetical protein
LEQLIDQRIALSKRKPVSFNPHFHTLPEIRQLVMDHYDELWEEFGDQSFELGALRHVLSKMTTLRPGDYELNGTTAEAQPRWEAQVAAVAANDWPGKQENPFEDIKGRRAHYRLRKLITTH